MNLTTRDVEFTAPVDPNDRAGWMRAAVSGGMAIGYEAEAVYRRSTLGGRGVWYLREVRMRSLARGNGDFTSLAWYAGGEGLDSMHAAPKWIIDWAVSLKPSADLP